MTKSASYKQATCCNGHEDCCYYSIDGSAECWGQVIQDTVDDEDGDTVPVHVCQGHRGILDGGEYVREPNGE